MSPKKSIIVSKKQYNTKVVKSRGGIFLTHSNRLVVDSGSKGGGGFLLPAEGNSAIS